MNREKERIINSLNEFFNNEKIDKYYFDIYNEQEKIYKKGRFQNIIDLITADVIHFNRLHVSVNMINGILEELNTLHEIFKDREEYIDKVEKRYYYEVGSCMYDMIAGSDYKLRYINWWEKNGKY